MSSKDEVFFLAPAGYVQALTDFGSREGSERLYNFLINEAIAARDLLRVIEKDGEVQIAPRGDEYELERYVKCREDTDKAFVDMGISPERCRWITQSQIDEAHKRREEP